MKQPTGQQRFKEGDRVRYLGSPGLGPDGGYGSTGTVSLVATGRGKSVHPDPLRSMTFVTWDVGKPQGVYTRNLERIDDVRGPTNEAQLHAKLMGGIDAARAVIANWERGDLAGAVNDLEGWADSAQELLRPKRSKKREAS